MPRVRPAAAGERPLRGPGGGAAGAPWRGSAAADPLAARPCRSPSPGRLFLTHTKLDGVFTWRFAIGGTYTLPHHIEAAWATIQQTLDATRGGGAKQQA